ncbi:MAG: hypothetical protein IPP40_10380 [bacterium]|nr:hypothetical protein [bacterium]
MSLTIIVGNHGGAVATLDDATGRLMAACFATIARARRCSFRILLPYQEFNAAYFKTIEARVIGYGGVGGAIWFEGNAGAK